jgi:hypothetical protein
MSWPVGKCPNMDRSDLFSLIGKQQNIAHLIAGHPVHVGILLFHFSSSSSPSFSISILFFSLINVVFLSFLYLPKLYHNKTRCKLQSIEKQIYMVGVCLCLI